MKTNPKQAGSVLVDCVPQTGPCPNNCNECYYNKCFYAGLESHVPHPDEVGDRIVRMNSGHDSNIEKELVLQTAKRYRNVFFNTSIPDFTFPGPVVYTANRREETDSGVIDKFNYIHNNLMFVRLRVSSTNVATVRSAVHWWARRYVPVVLTFMRYSSIDNIHASARDKYRLGRHIENSWYIPTDEFILDTISVYRDWYIKRQIHVCGWPSALCRDCGLCEGYYKITMNRLQRR